MPDFVDPDRTRFGQFKELARDGVIQMLNLVRLKPIAAYEDGSMVTGAEAYGAYSRESAPVFHRLGGRIVWSAAFDFMLIGPTDEAWDLCFIAEYPSADAFIEMLRDPVYRVAVKHRQAAVQTSRLIRLRPKPADTGFG